MVEEKRNSNKFVRFSGLGIQMAVFIAGGALGGDALDKKMQNEKPIFTIIFSLLGIALSLYFVIRGVLKLSDED